MLKKIRYFTAFALIMSGNSFAINMNFQNYNSTDTVVVNILPNNINTTKCLNGATPVIATPNSSTLAITGTVAGQNTQSTNLSVQNPSSSYCFSGVVNMTYSSTSSNVGGYYKYLCVFKYYYDSTNGWNPQVIVSRTTPSCSVTTSNDTGKFCIWGSCQ